MDPHDNDQRAAEAMARSEAAFAAVDEMNQTLAERRRLREERGEPVWRSPEPLDPRMRTSGAQNRPVVDPPHPMHRPAGAPRNWIAEAAWIREICSQQLKAFGEEFAAGAGQVIGETARSIEKEVAALRADLDAVKAELRRDDELGRGIQRLERLTDRLEQIDRRVSEREDDLIVDELIVDVTPAKPH